MTLLIFKIIVALLWFLNAIYGVVLAVKGIYVHPLALVCADLAVVVGCIPSIVSGVRLYEESHNSSR